MFEKKLQASSNEHGYCSGPSEVRQSNLFDNLASNDLDLVSKMKNLYLIIT